METAAAHKTIRKEREHDVARGNRSAESGPVVRLEHVKKSFEGREVLKDISMEVKAGENVVVLGKSGTGKTVIIKCIVGLITPDSGKIMVLGKNVARLDE